jgi:diguanylate cyclase (GGDEF)-like protein/putative nucleotidyltransferase with HDIG domain
MIKHIQTRILIIMIPISMVVVLIAYWFSINIGKSIIDVQTESKINAQQQTLTTMIEKELDSSRMLSDNIASMAGNTYRNTGIPAYENILRSAVNNNPFILGAGIWFEPYGFNKTLKYVGHYVYKRNNQTLVTDDYANESYDYLSQDFYRKPKEQSETVFSEAYYDGLLDMYLITCSSPIIDTDGHFLGCITVDIQLSTMLKMVKDYSNKYGGEVCIVNKEGYYLACSDGELIKNRGNITETESDSYNSRVKELLRSESGIIDYVEAGKTNRLYYTAISPLGWKILFEIPEKELNQPLKKINTLFLIISLISLLMPSITIYCITSRNIIRPIKILEADFKLIGENDFKVLVPKALAKRKDEFGRIGHALFEMKHKLWQYQQSLNKSMEELIASGEEIQQQNEELIDKEKQLLETSRYISSLIMAIPDMIFVISENGRFIDVQGNEKNLYMPKEDFLGKHISEVLPSYIAYNSVISIEAAIQTGKIQIFEYELKNDREEGYFEVRIAPFLEDRVIGIVRNITDSHNQMKEVEYLGLHDQLTGLYNRRYFEHALLALEQEERYPLGIVFSDVNGLKVINDSFGHDVGDILLKKYAEVLKSGIESDEVVSRIGGDEFTIILYQKNESELKEYVKKIEERCSKEQINGITLSISIGFGIIYSKKDLVQNVLKYAEDQMYRNKFYDADSRQSGIIDVIMKTLQEKNPREEQHSHRVAELCEKMAFELKFSNSEIQKIRTAGLLHDIGKIGIPEELLNKPGQLTREEYEVICKHSEIGHRILQSVSHVADIAEIVLCHHERWDGKGYPKGLKGEEIPLVSRIISIADTYDAMTSDRSYREALTEDIAVKELILRRGTQFDPYLTDFFVERVLKRE